MYFVANDCPAHATDAFGRHKKKSEQNDITKTQAS